METAESEENDTDGSIKTITEIKPLTDRKNHITMTIKNDGTEKEFIVDIGSPVIRIPPDKERTNDKKSYR